MRDSDRMQEAVVLLTALELSAEEGRRGRLMSHADVMARLDTLVDTPGGPTGGPVDNQPTV